MPADIQHKIARKLLRLIEQEGFPGKLTYQGAAKLLKRPNPQDDGRAFGSICDLLDAAACLAGVPALALIAIKNADGRINPRAWRQSLQKRNAILKRSETHTFTKEDFAKIRSSLDCLYPLGNAKAWKYLKQIFDGDQLERRLLGDVGISTLDALNDFDSEPAAQAAIMAIHFSEVERCGRKFSAVPLALANTAGGKVSYKRVEPNTSRRIT